MLQFMAAPSSQSVVQDRVILREATIAVAALLAFSPLAVLGGDTLVADDASLRAALREAKGKAVIKIAPGDYAGGHSVRGVEGLTIEALDPKNPPCIRGGGSAFHFSRCPGLTLRRLRITGQTGNGVNLDDGGLRDQPVMAVTLEHLEISDIGPRGNHDGIKCSGLDKLVIRDCTITGWGGQGIDCVGCHHVLVTGCEFTGKEGFTASAGVQLKGGTSDVIVEKCRFANAGERPVNIGGSTGLEFFRPPGATHEAARIVVRDNRIEGSLCAAAFVGVDGAEFSSNTICHPSKWIFRILQETREPGFAPCRNVIIKGNDIVFRRSQVLIEINIGDGTAPGTFRFEKNRWLAEDKPGASRPRLPVAEEGGVYGERASK